MSRLLKVEEVALSIGVSVKTVNNWYAFKRDNPDNDYAKLLPEFEQEHSRATRYWHKEDIWKLMNFKHTLPTGRGGVMGSITQKYVKK